MYCELVKNYNTFPVTLADDIEISPSTLFAVASILENCSYINGSPQNTFVPGQVNFKGRTEIIVDILNTYIHTYIALGNLTNMTYIHTYIHCTYIHTLGVLELSEQHGVFICGDDFKSGMSM